MRGVVAHWELYAEDHVDLLAFRRVNEAIDAMDENAARARPPTTRR